MVDVKVDFGNAFAYITMKTGANLDKGTAQKALPSGYGVSSFAKLNN